MTNDRHFLWRNFHGVVSTRPPPVICALFLGVFALGCFALGYYVQHNNIVDAEATKVDYYFNMAKRGELFLRLIPEYT